VADAPTGWTTPSGGGLNLVTDYADDDLGRTTQELGPVHVIDVGGTATSVRRATWTVYKDETHEVWTGQGYQKVSDSSFTLINPVSTVKRDARGNVLEQTRATRASTSGKLQPTDSFPQSSYVRWTTYQYTECCLLSSMRVYHTIPTSGCGTEGTNYDETEYGYDSMKRRNRTVSPGGTITFDVFDARSQRIETWVGTNDDDASETDPSGGRSDPDNDMVLVTANEYDGGQDAGDGNLTEQTQHVDGSTTRVKAFAYDWRDRQVDIDGEIDFFQRSHYDNLDRVVKVERYDTMASGTLVARQETKFDDRGKIYRPIRWGVDPLTGTLGNNLSDNFWFDAAGNEIKSLPAGAQLFTKTVYDSLNRPTAQYVGYDLDETSYNEAGTISSDTILEQMETVYDDAGNVIQTATRQRYHDAGASETGALNGPAGPTPKARVTYMAHWQDAFGREIAIANYGTNGGIAPSRPSTVPTRSDTVLVTTIEYNSRGELFKTIDPADREDRTEFDDAGRRTKLIENFVDGDPEPGASDEDRSTEWTYAPDGGIESITAITPDTGNQTTTYVYGTTLGDSNIARSDLLRAEVYPDSVGGSDRIEYKYDRQTERTETKDQNGTVHAFDYDALGKLMQDRATMLGTNVDATVRRIAATYEVRGLVETVTSYDNATVGQGNVVNQVRFDYNNFGQLVTDYQSHSGAVNTSTTPKVEYGHADASANTIRPTSLAYPNGRVVTYGYGATDGMNDAASRVESLIDSDAGSTHLADYSYLALRVSVVVDYAEPEIKYTLVDLSGNNDPDTGDIYSGLDRFGRVKGNRWYDYGSSADLDRIKYGYDRAGNRLWRENVVARSLSKEFDELYSYDGLHRLKDMGRGTLDSGHTVLTSKTFAQHWELDSTGNWGEFRQDDDGDATWELEQERTSNEVNEITEISEAAGPSWATPAYSAAGNMTTVPKPTDLTGAFTATYDAWNRLVKLVDDATSDTVQENAYDGRRFRIVRKDYAGGSLDATRHCFFTQDWQIVEERIDESSDAERQFVWGLRYVDDLIRRDRDEVSSGILDEHLYGLQDVNWNVTATTDSAGVVQEREAYQPFGNVTFLTPAFSFRTTSALNFERLFTGQGRDTTTGLHDFRERWYESALGQFLTRDPIGYIDGMSLYAAYFVPLAVDPTGNAICDCCNAHAADAPRTGLGGLVVRPGGGLPVIGVAQCAVDIQCTAAGCPGGFPASTGQAVLRGLRRTITICLDCRMANLNYHQTLLHELQHAADFCDRPPPAAMDLASCQFYEGRAYDASCGYLFPDRGAAFARCVACGVFFSCRRYGAVEPDPPCDISGGVPTRPCWRYDPERGFVRDPTDPRCRPRPPRRPGGR
jgi:RHS repeat-associated protein